MSCAGVINWRQLTLTNTDGWGEKGSFCLICYTNTCKTANASPARQHRGATRCLSSGTKYDVGARGDGRDGGGACWDEWHHVTAFIDTSSSGWERICEGGERSLSEKWHIDLLRLHVLRWHGRKHHLSNWEMKMKSSDIILYRCIVLYCIV